MAPSIPYRCEQHFVGLLSMACMSAHKPALSCSEVQTICTADMSGPLITISICPFDTCHCQHFGPYALPSLHTHVHCRHVNPNIADKLDVHTVLLAPCVHHEQGRHKQRRTACHWAMHRLFQHHPVTFRGTLKVHVYFGRQLFGPHVAQPVTVHVALNY